MLFCIVLPSKEKSHDLPGFSVIRTIEQEYGSQSSKLINYCCRRYFCNSQYWQHLPNWSCKFRWALIADLSIPRIDLWFLPLSVQCVVQSMKVIFEQGMKFLFVKILSGNLIVSPWRFVIIERSKTWALVGNGARVHGIRGENRH